MIDEKTGDKLVRIIKHAYLFEIVLWDHMTEYHFECYPYITDDRQIDTVRFATKINHNNSKRQSTFGCMQGSDRRHG